MSNLNITPYIKEDVKHLRIPLQDISLATNNFSVGNRIGNGGFGTVYKGVSKKHGEIAVKWFNHGRQGKRDKEFEIEIAQLSKYKHENIVPILGFCDEGGQKLLIYRYESNGSLDRYLSNPDLTWGQRLRICLDAARGLRYLHHDVGPQHRVLHRDVKSANILLDENWNAKIYDFGLSKIGPANMEDSFLISHSYGTFGYIDPDYLISGVFTKESDVYSFGVVLWEVMCGRHAFDSSYDYDSQFLTRFVRTHYMKKNLEAIIPSYLRKQMNIDSLATFSYIAYQCLEPKKEERPTMMLVVEELQKALLEN